MTDVLKHAAGVQEYTASMQCSDSTTITACTQQLHVVRVTLINNQGVTARITRAKTQTDAITKSHDIQWLQSQLELQFASAVVSERGDVSAPLLFAL